MSACEFLIKTIEEKDYTPNPRLHFIERDAVSGTKIKIPYAVSQIYGYLLTTKNPTKALQKARSHREYGRFFSNSNSIAKDNETPMAVLQHDSH